MRPKLTSSKVFRNSETGQVVRVEVKLLNDFASELDPKRYNIRASIDKYMSAAAEELQTRYPGADITITPPDYYSQLPEIPEIPE
jgi:hypothetical protein